MRTVRNDVYHVWVHQTQATARNSSGSQSFRDSMAFSYGACIGQIVTNPQGVVAFYCNTRVYSVTTSRHQSELRRAIPSDRLAFSFGFSGTVPNLPEILAQYVATIEGHRTKALRCKSYRAMEFQVNCGNDTRDELARFQKFNDLPRKVPALLVCVNAERLRAYDAEADKRNAIRDKAHAEKWAEERRLRELEFEDSLAAWLAGGPSVVSWGDPDYLRANGGQVQTSRRASVPLADVRAALPLVLRVMDSGKPWSQNDARISLGCFTLQSVDPVAELVTVGCHRFTYSEIRRFAATL